MKIIFITPAMLEIREKRIRPLNFTPSFNLTLLAALTPPGVEMEIIDEDLGAIDYNIKGDMVAITVSTPAAVNAYRIADKFRLLGKTVVLGGIHPSLLPEEAITHADALVLGEAETAWPQLIKDYQAHQLKKIYKYENRTDMKGLPEPRRDLLKKNRYIYSNQVSVTRGCPYACTFCIVSRYYGGKYRFRPVEEVIAEVKKLKKEIGFRFLGISNTVFFVDDNIAASRSYAKQLFKALIPLKIKWIGETTLTIAMDDELLSLAQKSGCIQLFLGFESLNPENLQLIRKKHNDVDKYETIIRNIHSCGMSIVGGFIFGFENDDKSVFAKTLAFTLENKLEVVDFTILTPFPGTQLYEELEKSGRILSKDWSRYDASQVVFQPKQMTPSELEMGTHWAWKGFYKLSSIYKRIGIFHPYLISNWYLNLSFYDEYKAEHKMEGAAAAVYN